MPALADAARIDPASSRDPELIASLRAVSKRYGPHTALDGFSMALRRGEVVALLGPNGAGKTTAVKLLLGLLRPASGSVRVLGRDPRSSAARAAIGAMLQVARVPDMLTVREQIELFRSYYPRPLPTPEVLRLAAVGAIEHQRFGTLSGGQRQRALFALAICGDPALVCLDEPTVGLDVHSRRQVWEQVSALAAAGKAVLLTTHYLEEADALAHRIVLINEGRLVRAGTPAQIKQGVAGRRIRCRTQLTPQALRALPSVTAAEADQERVVIFTHDPEAVLRRMLTVDAGLSDLEVTTASLDEAFLALTTA